MLGYVMSCAVDYNKQYRLFGEDNSTWDCSVPCTCRSFWATMGGYLLLAALVYLLYFISAQRIDQGLQEVGVVCVACVLPDISYIIYITSIIICCRLCSYSACFMSCHYPAE